LAKSRHPVDEAGFDTVIDKLQSVLDQNRAGPGAGEGSKLSYEGKDQAAGLEKPCHKIVRVTEQGERWVVYIDPDNHLPALVEATAADGVLLERYVFRAPKTVCPELAKADAFDPVARWGEPKGFLQKLARAAAAAAAAEPPQSP
jgi:glycine/D-amino acid oxidase-like deaminating enzyme